MIFIFSAEVSEFECDELLDDIKATKKDTALRLALSRLASDFGRESMLSLQRFFSSRRAPVISTGSLKLDIALGVGGLPKVIIRKAKFFSSHILCEHMHRCTPHIYARDRQFPGALYQKRCVGHMCMTLYGQLS